MQMKSFVLRKLLVLDMSVFALFEVEGASSSEIKPRVPNAAEVTTWSSWLILERNRMFTRYVKSLSKFKLEKQLRFAAKVNIMHIHIHNAMHIQATIWIKYVNEIY